MDVSIILAVILIVCTIIYFILSFFVSLRISNLLFEINAVHDILNTMKEDINQLITKKKEESK